MVIMGVGTRLGVGLVEGRAGGEQKKVRGASFTEAHQRVSDYGAVSGVAAGVVPSTIFHDCAVASLNSAARFDENVS